MPSRLAFYRNKQYLSTKKAFNQFQIQEFVFSYIVRRKVLLVLQILKLKATATQGSRLSWWVSPNNRHSTGGPLVDHWWPHLNRLANNNRGIRIIFEAFQKHQFHQFSTIFFWGKTLPQAPQPGPNRKEMPQGKDIGNDRVTRHPFKKRWSKMPSETINAWRCKRILLFQI